MSLTQVSKTSARSFFFRGAGIRSSLFEGVWVPTIRYLCPGARYGPPKLHMCLHVWREKFLSWLVKTNELYTSPRGVYGKRYFSIKSVLSLVRGAPWPQKVASLCCAVRFLRPKLVHFQKLMYFCCAVHVFRRVKSYVFYMQSVHLFKTMLFYHVYGPLFSMGRTYHETYDFLQ